MKVSIELKCKTSKEWLDAVLLDFNSFLQDHADCERKASAMALSFVAKYPDRKEIIPELIETAVEELEHFQQVYKVMEDRGVALSQEITKDEYMNQFLALCRSGKTERFMDRLLMASIVECRGCERFKLVAENLDDPELSTFYKELWRSEARHGNLFVSMALNYFDEESVFNRLDELATKEAGIIQNLDIKAAVH